MVGIQDDSGNRTVPGALPGLRRTRGEGALLPSKAPFSKRFEDAVGQACESAAASRVAKQFGLAASTVRAIDQRYLARWAETRRKPALRQVGVDEIFLGKKQKFVTVVSNLDTGEPLWFGQERKKETLDEFFRTQLSAFQRSAVRAACVDMWDPFRQSIEEWLPQCRIVYDKFHIMKHAGAAVDEVRRQEFFRKGGPAREKPDTRIVCEMQKSYAPSHARDGARSLRSTTRSYLPSQCFRRSPSRNLLK